MSQNQQQQDPAALCMGSTKWRQARNRGRSGLELALLGLALVFLNEVNTHVFMALSTLALLFIDLSIRIMGRRKFAADRTTLICIQSRRPVRRPALLAAAWVTVADVSH